MSTSATCYACGNPTSEMSKHCSSCGTRLMLLDRFRIVRLIGQGGFGAVYEVVDTRIGRTCAIKIIPAPSPAQREQIKLEAEILGRYASRFPFIPDVYDILDDAQQTYLVMEYIEGATLDRSQPLPWSAAQAESALSTLLGYLAQLHSVGIVHRDIKPQNIMRKPDGQYVLVDFGIAKQGATTQRAANALSPDYAPPEQLTGHTDARSDLYSLGATIYYLLTGQPPTPFSIRQAGGILQPPSRLAANVRPELDAVLLQMLEPNPATRPISAQSALDRLQMSRTMPTPLPGPQLTPQPTPQPTPRSRTWLPLAIGGVVLLCILGSAGALGMRAMLSGKSTPTPAGIGAASTKVPPTRTPRPSPARTPTAARSSPTPERDKPTAEPSPLPAPSPENTLAPTAAPPEQAAISDLGHAARFLYGPENGDLIQQKDYIGVVKSGVQLTDSIVQASFSNPPASGAHGWDYGFLFRHTDEKSNYQVFVTSERRWFFYAASGNDPIKEGRIANLNVAADGSNTLRLVVSQNRAFFFVNGSYIDTLDVSQKIDGGDIKVGTSFFNSDTIDGNKTPYHDLMIWSLDPNPAPPDGWRGSLVASDDFADNRNKWYLGAATGGDASREIRDSALVMTFKEPNRIWPEDWTVGNEQNFVSEIDVAPLSENGEGGLVFGYTDKDNYYSARISPQGDYTLDLRQGGQWKDPSPLPWKDHSAIIKGAGKSNRVLLTREGDQVNIYVNSVLVGTARADALTSGHVGVAAASGNEPNEEIRLSSFRLWRLP